MKTYLLKPMVVVCLCLLTASFTFAADNYKMVKVKAPFPMQPIKVFIYPDKDFLITDYGAKNGGKVNNTKAIAAAIEACHKSGGGRVVVPAGIWLTGPIHFKSNVNLYLEENAILNFTDNPSDYLPAVMTSWEGLECYNYSPLLYAFECENVAITGKGTLQPKMDTWKVWFKRPQPHLEALKELYTKRSDILKKKIPTPLRTLEIERIMRDPFLMLLRKSAGLTEELTPAEYSALLNKEIQTEVTDPQKLISLAIASYTESDGREAIYYYRKALDCKELPSNIRVFIEQSLSRLLNPDIYDGGIGLIILEIQENSMLSERLNIGDVIFKINGNVLLEPAEILSTMATASKEENILLEVYTKEQKRISISLPGRTHLECIVSQSVMLNLFFI